MPAPMPTTAELVSRIETMLSTRGPMTERQVHDALVADGLHLGRDGARAVHDVLMYESPLTWELHDDLNVFLPALLDGRVFTHRLTAAELSADVLASGIDLGAVSAFRDDPRFLRLPDGRALEAVNVGTDADILAERGISGEDHEEFIVLPTGFLAELGIEPGDLVGLRPSAGRISIEPLEATTEPADDLTDRFARAMAHSTLGNGGPSEVDIVVWDLCLDDSSLFVHPHPPISELVDRFGLVRVGDAMVGPPGHDHEAWRLQRRTGHLRDAYGLSEDEALAVLAMAAVFGSFELATDQFADHIDADETADADADADAADTADAAPASGDDALPFSEDAMQATLAFLDSPQVATALLAETVGARREPAAALGVFVDTLAPRAPADAQPAMSWLRAKAHERLSNVLEAESDLQESLRLDPNWRPALLDLAQVVADRGDAAGALSLLQRAGVDDADGLVILLRAMQRMAKRDLGRNERCWCGSGRKYKQCHLGRDEVPLEERAAWLYQKAGAYLHDGPFRSQLLELAEERSRYSNGELALLEALNDPIVGDSMLFEGGAFAEFLHDRGVLLPTDEHLLAQQWLLIERSVFEVTATNPGESVTVHDIRTGDDHVVRERTASRTLEPSDLVCARVVPAGDTMQFFGGIELVPLPMLDTLIELLDTEPEPYELVSLLTSRFAPPKMTNTEGDDIVFCDISGRVTDPAAMAAALDDRYGSSRRGDDGSVEWVEHVVTHGTERVRAALTMSGDIVRVDVNSEERAERVLAVLREIDPDIEVTEDKRTPLDEALEERSKVGGRDPAPQFDQNDPDVRRVLDEMTRQQEQEWLDLDIPALAGLTPRQAAADPTRREDLIRLLATFDHLRGQGGFDTDRLRSALGL